MEVRDTGVSARLCVVDLRKSSPDLLDNTGQLPTQDLHYYLSKIVNEHPAAVQRHAIGITMCDLITIKKNFDVIMNYLEMVADHVDTCVVPLSKQTDIEWRYLVSRPRKCSGAGGPINNTLLSL